MKFSRFCLILTAALFAATAGAATQGPGLVYKAPPGAPKPLPAVGIGDPKELEAFLDGVMSAHLKYEELAGATLSVVKDGKVILVKGYGYADLAKRIPVDGQTSLFRPGSTSKLFTWTAVMQLVEQGKLDLDADVNTYLKDFQIPKTYEQPITLRNLMTHSAGLEDGGVGYLFAKDASQLTSLGESLKKHMPSRVRPPTTDFGGDGTNSSYSNWGTALAGHIVATVSGMSFEDYIQKNIFEPLGMTSSTFQEPLPKALAPHMATGYIWKAGKLEPYGFEFVHNFGPAGALTSSAADMAKFMIAHLNDGELDGKRILKKETAELMHQRQFGASPYLNGSGLGFYETWTNGHRIIGHAGDMISFHTDLFLLPEAHVGMFVSYNSSHEEAPHIARRDLLKAFMDRYYPAELPPVKAPDDFAQRAAKYAGTYKSNRGSYTKWEKVFGLFGSTKVMPAKDNQLLITDLLLPGPSYWVEVAPDTFREANGEGMIAFVEKDGQVTHLVNSFTFIGSHKLKWCETPAFHYLVLGFGILAFAIAIASALKNWRADRAAPAASRRARHLAALLGVVQIAGLAMMAVTFAGDLDQLIYALPQSFYIAQAFPILAIPLTLLVVWGAVGVWREKPWTRYQRVQYHLIALASVLFLWSLNFWNLIGYKIG